MKSYNNLTDVEKHIIREYNSWKKSDCPVAYKFEMLTYWQQRAKEANITYLL